MIVRDYAGIVAESLRSLVLNVPAYSSVEEDFVVSIFFARAFSPLDLAHTWRAGLKTRQTRICIALARSVNCSTTGYRNPDC